MADHGISAKRKNDAVINVCQDNDRQQLVIEALNQAAERLTGYLGNEIIDKTLSKLLPSHIKEVIDSELEFDTSGYDLADVLRKIRHFEIINRDGHEVPVSLKVFYVVSSHMNKPEFELLIRDVTVLNKVEELKQHVKETTNQQEGLDGHIGVPSKETILKILAVIQDSVAGFGIEAVLATVEVDNILEYRQKHGVETATEIAKQVCEMASGNLREGDFVGYLGDGVFSIVLLDCNEDDAKMVLNRIRMMVESNPIVCKTLEQSVNSTLSIGFAQITSDIEVKALIRKCTDALEQAKSAGGNTIYIG